MELEWEPVSKRENIYIVRIDFSFKERQREDRVGALESRQLLKK